MSTIRRNLVFAVRSLRHLFWPAVCISCGVSIGEGDKNLCEDCWGQLLAAAGGDYCPRCGRDASRYGVVDGACPDCLGREIYFDGIARAGAYEQAMRDMILAFKLGDRTELDSVLGFLGNSALAGAGFYKDVEFFVPVPLHWSRRLSRGYNQSMILAKQLRHRAAKINTDLVRIRRTKSQTLKATAAARAANVAGAFSVRAGHKLEGRRVCLVDDVKTSGATLNECAKTLKEAGAGKVFSLVLAVAGQYNR